jgi:mandelate racemase
MQEPHQTASGTITEFPLVLTDVLTDAGVEGHSIVFTYTAAALKPTAELIQNFEPLVAQHALAPATVTDSLLTRFRLLGSEGLVGMAIAAIDMACWDALARLYGVSLAALLGTQHKTTPAYGAIGFDGVKGSARTAEHWAARGFKGVKAKIGYPDFREEVEVIRAIRNALSPGMALMVDYNQCLTPVEAVDRIRRLEDEGLDIAWVEEPVGAHDLKGHAFVAREVATPVQCGENWWGPLELTTAIEERASDYVMLDAMKIGGVTGWLRAAALASVSSIRVSNHLWPEISAQLLCASPTAHYLEYADWWNPILAEPLRIENGLTDLDG